MAIAWSTEIGPDKDVATLKKNNAFAKPLVSCNLHKYCFSAPAEDGERWVVQPAGVDGDQLGRLGEWDDRQVVGLTLYIMMLDTSELSLIVNYSKMVQKLVSATKHHSAHCAWNEVMQIVHLLLLQSGENRGAHSTLKLPCLFWQKSRSFNDGVMLNTEVSKTKNLSKQKREIIITLVF